ncbi:hypothetical protein M413DRAFT_442441 [Hebeloma cylindrosporum]|uniref:Uncharacterized protein n=1 Tax=Hebeloma cylindrosporum TaxID=76867 RepID=A0A0C3CL02_HEBCY|nr:hypothetical protein M413DRAFT_442441 [Hebeloma cylindrosporum h7]
MNLRRGNTGFAGMHWCGNLILQSPIESILESRVEQGYRDGSFHELTLTWRRMTVW